MRARLCRALGWALLALAVLGLSLLAAALPADGYELRFAAPLTAAQAEALRQAAGDAGIDLALWREDAASLTAPSGRTAPARMVCTDGSPALCFPARYLSGTAPGAGQQDGCAVSAALADALFGSRQVTGLTLEADGRVRRITGVFAGSEPLLLCPSADPPAGGYTAASLAGVPAGDPRGAAGRLVQSAGLAAGDGVTLLPCGTLRGALALLAGLPLLAAAAALAWQLWRSLPLRGGGRWAAGLGLAAAAALALPALLAALPRWLIPSRWADLSFWGGLAETLGQSLLAFVSLPDTARDRRLGILILAAAGCLAAMAAGALLLSLAGGRHADAPAKRRGAARRRKTE